MEQLEKLSNAELVNLCEYLLKSLNEPGIYEVYHQQDWQELENATSELLTRTRTRSNKDLDTCELSDFSYLIDKAVSALKHK